ncbi:hypothetical protein LOZ52_002924 [Ophidiomyces ophidiicola]|nr:hypothetical protein LOZ64_001880 [Ophidiomyces ophidiicola]KAI1999909.1 hypothetical protein LOZ50_006375 [Ophidiomyces ophidiicola]KAI2004279.1 hypothetical protein LOZ49_005918 [Ophidiomyces ophidiicola]KAI2128494.1 hypothetical protein LOZ29_006365 [Ophidiomyces ophidiicola]KAI2130519.1 hypothetical protein LOZ28_006409 [Ophidiomyces ophidiicola]
MSADLFAEFGNPNAIDNTAVTKSSTSTSYTAPRHSTASGQSTLIDFTFDLQPEPSFSIPGHIQQPQTHTSGDTEVLFDASIDSALSEASEDDWGDFESAEPRPAQGGLSQPGATDTAKSNVHMKSTPKLGTHLSKPTAPSLDLLSIDDTEPPPKTPVPKLPLLSCNVENIPSDTTPQDDSEPVTAWPHSDEDDWGEFTDGVASENGPKQTMPLVGPMTLSEPNQISMDMKAPSPITINSQKVVRPTNIPPPSILLRLFPSLLEKLCNKVSTSKLRTKEMSGSLPDSTLVEDIKNSAKVMIYIILGRSLRWKRDSILSQSTKIGPASGRSGGMKLSSVNKSENMREEKEAVEVLDIWNKRGGLLNSVLVAGGKQSIQLTSRDWQVKTASAQEGGINASHACALCGLRRDERISKVDETVDDIFEEWWTEHWGHSDCRHFWDVHSVNLDQR